MDDRKAIREIQNGNKEYLNLLAEKYYDDMLLPDRRSRYRI